MKFKLFAAALAAATTLSFVSVGHVQNAAYATANPVICPNGVVTYDTVCPTLPGTFQCPTGQAWSSVTGHLACSATMSTRTLACAAGAQVQQVPNSNGVRYWRAWAD